MNPTEIRSATTAQMNAHLASMRDPLSPAIGIRNAVVLSVAMWAGVGLAIAQVLS